MSPAAVHAPQIDPRRIRRLNNRPAGAGPVVYWMSRDQRVTDNWALLHARALAAGRGVPLAVVFNLVPTLLGATLRQFAFMLRGLEEVERDLTSQRIPFALLTGDPAETVPRFVADHGVGMVVTDFSPLRIARAWRTSSASAIPVAFEEVDAHNIVPAWLASDKREFAARTIRPKLERRLPDFLTELPALEPMPTAIAWPREGADGRGADRAAPGGSSPDRRPSSPSPGPISLPPTDWTAARASLRCDEAVGEVDWLEPGPAAARRALASFVAGRLHRYAERNDPLAGAESDLSPYLHFGQLAPQRAALATVEARASGTDPDTANGFLEQLIVRRELAENFCLYTPGYDRVEAFPDWATGTLDVHRADPREYLYDLEDFEAAETHDPIWNAAQSQMVKIGKMHNYLRMYWAKKILEWSASPEEALSIAIHLNDRYELDGRDPNGYAGIAWSIGGVHDRAWAERPVYGKIRYMSAAGCRRKFDVDAYVEAWAP